MPLPPASSGGALRCSYRVLLLAPQKCLPAALKYAAYAFANTGFLLGTGYILQCAAFVLNVRISDTVEIGYDDLFRIRIYNQVWVMSDDDDLASFLPFPKILNQTRIHGKTVKIVLRLIDDQSDLTDLLYQVEC